MAYDQKSINKKVLFLRIKKGHDTSDEHDSSFNSKKDKRLINIIETKDKYSSMKK